MGVNALISQTLGVKTAMPRLGAGSQGVKLLIYGPIGSGKTYGLTDLVLLGERLLVVSTEQGGNGLVSIRNELLKRNKPELYDTHIRSLDLSEYDQVQQAFAKAKDAEGRLYPALYDIYPELREFQPTTLVWEGLTNFQLQHINNHLLKDHLRVEDSPKFESSKGGTDKYAYWGAVGRALSKTHQAFITLTDPDMDWNHILTVHDKAEWKRDEKGNRAPGQKKPIAIDLALQGSGDKAVKEAYDLIVLTRKDEVRDIKQPLNPPSFRHVYQVVGGSNEATVKSRGWDLEPEFDADLGRVWRELQKFKQTEKKEDAGSNT